MATEALKKITCKTTAAGNNCAFHCLTYFLVNEIISYNKTALEKRFQEPGYKALLSAFGKYYGVKNITPSQFQELCTRQYSNPIDREAVMGPVLRFLLSEQMKLQADSSKIKNFMEMFSLDVQTFFKAKETGNKRPDYINPYAIFANTDELESLYKNRGTVGHLDTFLNQKSEQLYHKFIDYMGNSGATISVEDIATLTESLGIRLAVLSTHSPIKPYYPSSISVEKDRTVTVFNSGMHWETILEGDKEVMEFIALSHNQDYKCIDELNTLKSQASAKAEDFVQAAKKSGAIFYDVLMPNISPETLKNNITNNVKASLIQAGIDPKNLLSPQDATSKPEIKTREENKGGIEFQRQLMAERKRKEDENEIKKNPPSSGPGTKPGKAG